MVFLFIIMYTILFLPNKLLLLLGSYKYRYTSCTLQPAHRTEFVASKQGCPMNILLFILFSNDLMYLRMCKYGRAWIRF